MYRMTMMVVVSLIGGAAARPAGAVGLDGLGAKGVRGTVAELRERAAQDPSLAIEGRALGRSLEGLALTGLTCKSSFKPDNAPREFRERLRTIRNTGKGVLVETVEDSGPGRRFLIGRSAFGRDGNLELTGTGDGRTIRLAIEMSSDARIGWDEPGFADTELGIDGRAHEYEKFGCRAELAGAGLEAAMDRFLEAAVGVQAGGAHPEMTLRAAVADFVATRAQLKDGHSHDDVWKDPQSGRESRYEKRVSIQAVAEPGPRGELALEVSVMLQSISYTQQTSGREYHDGESSMLEIRFHAVFGAKGWTVPADAIESDYMEG